MKQYDPKYALKLCISILLNSAVGLTVVLLGGALFG